MPRRSLPSLLRCRAAWRSPPASSGKTNRPSALQLFPFRSAFFKCSSTSACHYAPVLPIGARSPVRCNFAAKTMSAHVEDVRLAACGPRDVTLYTRPGCHLCDEAKSAIAPLLREFRASLHEVNIDTDPVLKERYAWDVPVIFIGQKKAAKHRVEVEQFRRQLQDAAAG